MCRHLMRFLLSTNQSVQAVSDFAFLQSIRNFCAIHFIPSNISSSQPHGTYPGGSQGYRLSAGVG